MPELPPSAQGFLDSLSARREVVLERDARAEREADTGPTDADYLALDDRERE